MNDESNNLESSKNFLSELENAMMRILKKTENKDEDNEVSSLESIVKTMIWFIDRKISKPLFDLIIGVIETTNHEKFYDMLIRHVSSSTISKSDHNCCSHDRRVKITKSVINLDYPDDNDPINLSYQYGDLIKTIAELAGNKQIHVDFRESFIKYIAKSLTQPFISEETNIDILGVITLLVSDEQLNISSIIHSQWFEGESTVQKLSEKHIEIVKELILRSDTPEEERGKMINTLCYLVLCPPSQIGEELFRRAGVTQDPGTIQNEHSEMRIRVPYISREIRHRLLAVIRDVKTEENITMISEHIEILRWLDANSHFFSSLDKQNYIYNGRGNIIKHFKYFLLDATTPELIRESFIKVIKQYLSSSGESLIYSDIFIDILQDLISSGGHTNILEKLIWVCVHVASINNMHKKTLVDFLLSILKNENPRNAKEVPYRLLDIFQQCILGLNIPKSYQPRESTIMEIMFRDFDLSGAPKPVLRKQFEVIQALLRDQRTSDGNLNLLLEGSFVLYFEDSKSDTMMSKCIKKNLVEVIKISFKTMKKTQMSYPTLFRYIKLVFSNESLEELHKELVEVIISLFKCPETILDIRSNLVDLMAELLDNHDNRSDSANKKLLEAIKALLSNPDVDENVKIILVEQTHHLQFTKFSNTVGYQNSTKSFKRYLELVKDYSTSSENSLDI